MSDDDPIRPGGSRRRFWFLAAILFAGQVGWILVFGERTHPVSRPTASSNAVRLLDVPLDEDRWTKYVFATDPSVFPSSSSHGFADLAWQSLPPNDYTPPPRQPPPRFLEYGARHLGADGDGEAPISARLFAPSPDAWSSSPPPFPPGAASRPESFVRVEGALAARQIAPPTDLPSWTTNILVSNSVVQFGVDRAGQVISAAVITGCGLLDADAAAVEAVSRFRFRPAPRSPAEFAWDTATFYWKIVPP